MSPSDPPSDVRRDPRRGGERHRRTRAAGGVEGIVERLRADPELGPAFAAWHTEPARPGRVEDLPARLHPALRAVLERRGMTTLYEHQVRAIDAALDGQDVLVATPTASGKTLTYTLPVLQSLLESDGGARAIWMFPTKALAQDQSSSFNAWIEDLDRPWHSFTYDGDTPPSIRRTLRDRGQVVLTNPWMLHTGILPNHGKWSQLFRGLEYVVVDEVHTLSGVFGSSVANVFRRLLRLARHYGANPRFLLSSATVRNPAEHARALLGRDVTVIDQDASPAGKKIFGVFEPPLLDKIAGLRANALEECRRLAPLVCGPNHQTIFFTNRRVSVEVLTLYLKEAAPNLGLEPDEIRGYRGGYLPLLRREIEQGLKSGAVRVVISTNALELGVDIGALDVCVLVGYPGNQASFWQRAGRVGRRGGTSLAVLVARSDPIDQFLAQHPDWLFRAPRESLTLDPDNLVILSEQLKCASFELPFEVRDGVGPLDFGDSEHVPGILDYLAEESGLLVRRPLPNGARWYWAADAFPAESVSLAGNEPDNVLIFDLDTKKAIGEIDREASITSVHEGAIYQVQGETYKVETFDYENRRAWCKKLDSDYFTEAETDTEVRVLRLEERRGRPALPAQDALAAERDDWSVWRGEVHVTTVATLYKKVRFYTRESVGIEDIHLPPEEIDTEACVFTLHEQCAEAWGLTGGDRSPAWRGVGRMLRRVAPLFVRCSPSDLGLATESRSKHFGAPAIFLYDRVPGSVGLGTRLFAECTALLQAALDVVSGCACLQGCPACVGPVEEVGALGKETVQAVLGHMLESTRLEPRAIEPEEAGATDGR
ncbi:MAG: DEAD/DEAH box helicase [Planctomycetota bacterium]